MQEIQIQWNALKNEWLKQERGVGFEDFIIAIQENRVLDSLEHPNTEKYPNQRVFIARIGQYIYAVPYVKTETGLFLKTIIPSRKYTKLYLNL
jgi:hypothetical protein